MKWDFTYYIAVKGRTRILFKYQDTNKWTSWSELFWFRNKNNKKGKVKIYLGDSR